MIFVCQDEFCQCGTTRNSGMETEEIELERGMRAERLRFSILIPLPFLPSAVQLQLQCTFIRTREDEAEEKRIIAFLFTTSMK